MQVRKPDSGSGVDRGEWSPEKGVSPSLLSRKFGWKQEFGAF